MALTELEMLEDIVVAEVLNLAHALKEEQLAKRPELKLADTEWIDRAIAHMHAHRSYILSRLEEHWQKVRLEK